ncbi:M15 family metallopeptidase [Simiduia curdlanivorans]|uniref:M15 family metallopeptidase n=1 Tax=Simiduia curdlanivorans TaxID=1492769 RepID=A0ABV8V0W5_9GAMM|nr:M15 family metallopeptidase [Simiduia curdlanivorans]MDN3639231.1 M15 family metallopeptidase [Simiduia curdlanivorans]
MKRRELFTGLFVTSTFALSNAWLWKYAEDTFTPQTQLDPLVIGDISDTESVVRVPVEAGPSAQPSAAPMAEAARTEAAKLDTVRIDTARTDPARAEAASANAAPAVTQPKPSIEAAKVARVELVDDTSILNKVRNFEQEFADDIHLSGDERIIMHSVLARLERAEAFIGHGNYNICSFDYLLKVAERYPQVGAFGPVELDFMERIFFADATLYGFMGEKVVDNLTAQIADRDVAKIKYSGQYVFRGQSEQYYQKLKKDIGDGIILTSGIRSNVKQMHLFLAKTAVSNYNLSKASRSLAPPGHSFHGVGDFDVGKVGWGVANFSDKFAQTDEFKRMQDLGYVQIRYTEDNRLGVRFEPWHIKVV